MLVASDRRPFFTVFSIIVAHDCRVKILSFLTIKFGAFPIFNIVSISKLGISRNINENLGESRTETEERPFFLLKFGNIYFPKLYRWSEI